MASASMKPSTDKPAVTPEEKAQVKRWQDVLATELELHEDKFKEIRQWRRAADGHSDYDVSVNLHQSTLETLLPILYAQDPEMQAKVAESVDDKRYQELRPFAKTLEIVVNRQLRDARLKENSERVIRASKTDSYGVIKVCFQTDTEQDPVIIERMRDIQDNLKRIVELKHDIAEGGGDDGDVDAQKADLADTLKALEEKVEVIRAMGVVLDFVASDDWIVPHSVAELIDYKLAPWQAQRIWMPKEQAVADFELSDEEEQNLTTYHCRDSEKEDESSQAHDATGLGKAGKEGKKELACAFEIWDSRSQTVYTVLMGLDRYAKKPFAPQFVGKRFYPYFLLAFSYVSGIRWPKSAVGMADPLVQEYNATRSGFKDHRQNAIPATVFDTGTMSIEDAEKIRGRKRIENIGIDAQGQPVANLVTTLAYPGVDMGLYTTDPIRADIDQIYGIQDAMRGVVMKAKTATEADIMQQGTGARTLGQRSTLESWLQEIAQFVAEVLLIALPEQQVKEIAGEGAAWPQMTREQVCNLVSIDIRTGSTGQPDKAKDAQEWTQLIPEIMPLLEKYTQAMMQGQPGIAEALKNLIEETLRRFDDRIDVEMILPKVQPMPPPAPPQESIQSSAMNGPQVQALQGLVVAARTGALPVDAAVALIHAAFPHIDQKTIEGMVGTPQMHAQQGQQAPQGGQMEGQPDPGAIAQAVQGGNPDEIAQLIPHIAQMAQQEQQGQQAPEPLPPGMTA